MSAAGRVDELERTVREALEDALTVFVDSMWERAYRNTAPAALSELAVIARDGQRARDLVIGGNCIRDEGTGLSPCEQNAKRAEAAEAERDRYRQALERAATEIEAEANRRYEQADEYDDEGAHVGFAKHDRAVAAGLSEGARIVRAALSLSAGGVHAPTERPSGPAETQEANQ